jgi:hypothetical protein
MRTFGNPIDGYKCSPKPKMHVRIRRAEFGPGWHWSISFASESMGGGVANGPRAAANAATRWIRQFSKTLYDLSNKQP